MGWNTLGGSALWRNAALLPLLCAPWSVAAAAQAPQDSRADVASKLARVEELLGSKVREGKGWAEARAPLDKQIVEIELWLQAETAKLGPKDRAQTARTLGHVLAESRPPNWGNVVGKSIQISAAEVLGELAPEGAPVLLAGLKGLDPVKAPMHVWYVCQGIGKQGTPECFDALVAAAGRKEINFLRGAADGFSAWPKPTAEQRKAAFAALIDGLKALERQLEATGKKPFSEDPEAVTMLWPSMTLTLARLSGEKTRTEKDWEAWWKDHKKGEWK
jgi:hypothetical protein